VLAFVACALGESVRDDASFGAVLGTAMFGSAVFD